MLMLVLCDYIDAYFVINGRKHLGFDGNNDMSQKGVAFKNNLRHLCHLHQKSIMHSQEMQKVVRLLCQGIFYYNIVKIILQHQEVCGIIIEMKWIILMIKIQMVNNSSRNKIDRKNRIKN